MNAARPIKLDEYKAFKEELYGFDQEVGREEAKYIVALSDDPSMRPKDFPEKISKVQAFKNRVLVLLNRAILAEAYWKSVTKKLEGKFNAELNNSLISEAVGKLKSSDLRKAMASKMAGIAVVNILMDGKGLFEDHLYQSQRNHADAAAFLSEVKMTYENLDSAQMNLAVQLKALMVELRVHDRQPVEVA